MRVSVDSGRSLNIERVAVALLLCAQFGLLAYSATRHSPTDLEPAFLASGISHWQLNRFELYRVNPPLVRLVAALPVLAVGCETDWSRFHDSPGSRVQYLIGQDFIQANGADSVKLFWYARWACIPFNLIGSYVAFLWAKSLYGKRAGFVTLTLFAFEPNLLAHGELITPDGATTAFGIVAGFAFWRWLKHPSWIRVMLAGGALGLAELSKLSWLILFPLWPILWLVWRWMEPREMPASPQMAPGIANPDGDTMNTVDSSTIQPGLSQLAAILLLAIYLINLGYTFDGFCTPLKDFEFVSMSLSGSHQPGVRGNRFRDTWMGRLPVPLPEQYVLGFDSQKRDLESYYLPSYLRGEVKRHGGWWYYYAYGLLVKIPCGTWGLLAVVLWMRFRQQTRPIPLRDELVLLIPAVALFVIVSSQTEFNRHVRYVLPAVGLGLVFVGQAGACLTRGHLWERFVVSLLVLQSVISLAVVYPNQLAYFNAFAGGPANGYKHLTGSNLDWGQDLLFLRDHVQQTGQVVRQIQHSDISQELARAVLSNSESKTVSGHQIIVVSPNCLEKGIPFPPATGRMLTPTLWIVDYVPGAKGSPDDR